ncbi:probable fucosyltransferase 8 [Oryza brachyantha]|uniref:probable fucosyltransferase 8 n=1 Tax=Oryza brachyantha TaxID=4533 RepID=UPI001ADA3A76|nr:probable fucosyltransferase 8 [Oryza brachyantha]
MPAKGKRTGGGGAAAGATVARVFVVVCLMMAPLLLVLVLGGWAGASTVWQSATWLTSMTSGFTNASHHSATDAANGADELFGGLLAAGGFDRGACLSRHESPRYYKHSPFAPSPYLLQKLRDYEARHRRCGPGTPLYAKSVEQLRSGHSSEVMECNYVVFIPYNGLGNRMLTLLSSFLYALLTERVLLVDFPGDFTDLFCEPFPGDATTTWLLPSDFPVVDLLRLGVHSNQSYGNLLGAKKITGDPAKDTPVSVPPYVYLHLAHNLQRADERFYCNDDQLVLRKVNWLLVQSDLYFVPSLYAIPEFQDELRWLFPAKESVTHLLGRYLLHPSNTVWGMVTRYYHSYLAPAAERIGVQIRMFSWASIPVDDMYKQLLACSRQEHILPDIDGDTPAPATTGGARTNATGRRAGTTAILVASLQADYYERLKTTYYEHGGSGGGGGWVGVFQPSHEERQDTGKRGHNQKALAEIYLLSFSDVLLTTGVSTFGYMSSALAGLRPAILLSAANHKVPETPCARIVSMEPCFHKPPTVQCQGKAAVNENVTRHIKPCEDFPQGTKLFD